MGDPKKIKKKYSKPRHPWQKARIEEEKLLVIEYALKNKREVYRTNALIKKFIDHFKEINVLTTAQAQLEKEQLAARVKKLGFISADKDIEAVLDLKVKDALERRLQTLVFKKKLARTIKQARQFITHRHILVDGVVVDAPGYIVPVAQENLISFIARSPLFSELHPERTIVEKAGAAAIAGKESAEAIVEGEAAAEEEDVPAVEITIDDVETPVGE